MVWREFRNFWSKHQCGLGYVLQNMLFSICSFDGDPKIAVAGEIFAQT